MNSLFRWHVPLCVAAFLAAVPVVSAQQSPRIGYVYPAGGRQGTTFEVTVGGQYLRGVTDAYISGSGIQAKVTKYDRPLTNKQLNDLRQKAKELIKGRQAAKGEVGDGSLAKASEDFKAFAKQLGLESFDLKAFNELRKKLMDPKKQANLQIAETVTLQITLASDADLGRRELRLRSGLGVTNPLFFHVGQYAEYRESEPNDLTPDGGAPTSLPVIINGQILPGDVDRFRLQARKGMHVVAAVSARELIPYLADAVPGWFQAALTLYDAKGNEVAYTDDFRFNPDPIIYYQVPEDGEYVLEIKDAIYRGREDFAYRITLGETPFITSVFPLGGHAGAKTPVRLRGWNLLADSLTVDAAGKAAGLLPVSVRRDGHVSNHVPFALDTLPECMEGEPNDDARGAQQVKLPVIVNGHIDRPGDWDVLRFEGRAGEEIVAEVQARRLGSPLDSLLELTDAGGKLLAVNDDHEDKGAGLTTHQADSQISLKLPKDGIYFLRLGDTQRKGGPAYGYRLRISPPRPDFALRVVPSCVNASAGMTVPITVYALRKDGFPDEIRLAIKDAPQGFVLDGAWVPPGQDQVRMTLTVPQIPLKRPIDLHLEGRAVIGGQEVRRPAVPAEDMMQAFIYRHLVPTESWMVVVGGRRRYGPSLKLLGQVPVELSAGGTTQVRVSAPKGPYMQQVQLGLSDPPEGIAIKKVEPDPAGLAVLLSVDGAKVKPGLRGNLIVDAFIETAPMAKDGKARPKRRVSLGTLPAIPFEVVDRPRTSETRR